VRPVNLLPPKHRPHQPTAGKSGNSAYLVLGVLALCLVALVTYVMESNKITTAKSDIAVAEQKTAEARARAQQLGPFANFAAIKQQRVTSVKQLADGRFDWERTVRELAHVLPDGVWLQDFEAAVSGAAAGGSSTGESAWAGPSIKLHGCAQDQPQVATLLVRLKEMQGVHDVKLTDSTRGDDPAKTSGATGDSAGGGTSDGCGTHKSRANYQFNAVVEFEQTVSAPNKDAGETPVRLGGGS
jgi:Tfp pilus assembly protein PilN